MRVEEENYNSRWIRWKLKLAWHLWATERILVWQREWWELGRIWWRGRHSHSSHFRWRVYILSLWPKCLIIESMDDLQEIYKPLKIKITYENKFLGVYVYINVPGRNIFIFIYSSVHPFQGPCDYVGSSCVIFLSLNHICNNLLCCVK